MVPGNDTIAGFSSAKTPRQATKPVKSRRETVFWFHRLREDAESGAPARGYPIGYMTQ